MAKELRLSLIEPSEQTPRDYEMVIFIAADDTVHFGGYTGGVFHVQDGMTGKYRESDVKFWAAFPKRLLSVVTED